MSNHKPRTDLHELVTLLADHEPHLARLQDELERMTEHVQGAERHSTELRGKIGVEAIITGQRRPHPAITVQRKCFPRIGHTPVKIERDLSPWRSDDDKRPSWCIGCIIAPDKCKGVMGYSCAAYPNGRVAETPNNPRAKLNTPNLLEQAFSRDEDFDPATILDEMAF